MYYFKFSFELNLGWQEQTDSTTYQKNLAWFQRIASLYDLKISDSETSGFDQEWQKETLCIEITLSRQATKFRNAYNLLKICEASLDLYTGVCDCTLVRCEYDLKYSD